MGRSCFEIRENLNILVRLRALASSHELQVRRAMLGKMSFRFAIPASFIKLWRHNMAEHIDSWIHRNSFSFTMVGPSGPWQGYFRLRKGYHAADRSTKFCPKT